MQILADGTMKPLLPTAPEASSSRRSPSTERGDAFVGTNVFVLFDTAISCIAASSMPKTPSPISCAASISADSVAVYTFSRNLSRAAASHPRPQ